MRNPVVRVAVGTASAVVVAALVGSLAAPLAAEDGKAVFLAQKCNLCHSVSTAGIESTAKSDKMKGPDLAGAVKEKGKEWVTKWIKREVNDKDGKPHKKEWKGTDAELAAVVDWLATQNK